MSKRLAILVTILLLAGLVSAINYADTSLVGVWHLNNDTTLGESNSFAADSSLLRFGNASFSANVSTTASGKLGGGVVINDVGVIGEGLTVANDSRYKPSKFTVSAWAYPLTQTNRGIIISTVNATTTLRGYDLSFSTSNTISARVWNNTGTLISLDATYTGNTWNHVTMVFNGSNIGLYMNGILSGWSTDSLPSPVNFNNPNKVLFGGSRTTVDAVFNGTIDELYFWNRTLTDEEVYDVYNTGLFELGTCRTYWDYCLNITLPTIFHNDAGGVNDGLFLAHLEEITESNLEGIPYMNSTMTNIYAQIQNSTDYGWSGPSRSAIGSNRHLWTQTNTTDNLTAAATLQICLNGTYKNNLPAAAVPPGTGGPHAGERYLTLNDFQKYYRRNWTFLNEETGLPFDLAAGNAQMTVSCANHSSFNVNLTTVPYASSITVQSLEEPRYEVTAYGLTPRIRQDYTHFLRDYYVLSSSAATTRYTLTLMDYTGLQCEHATLIISKAIPGGVHVINSEPFDNDNTQYPGLQNNTQYHLTLHCDKLDYDLGMVNFVDNHLERSLVVNVPYINQYLGNTVGLLPGWTWSYAAGSVGATLTSAVSTEANFTVYDISLNPYNKTYSSNASGTGLVFTYTLPNKSRDYILELRINDTRYGVLTYQKPIRLVNSTIPLNTSAMNQPLPTEIVNIASTFLKSLISAFLIILFFFVGCKASSYGLGMIVGSMVFSFMWYVNWVPQSDIPWWFCVIMVLVSSLVKMHERRIT